MKKLQNITLCLVAVAMLASALSSQAEVRKVMFDPPEMLLNRMDFPAGHNIICLDFDLDGKEDYRFKSGLKDGHFDSKRFFVKVSA